MGLDMYLYAEKYQSTAPWREEAKDDASFYPPELAKVKELLGHRSYRSKTTRYLIGYWRKDWQLHSDIVTACGGGDGEQADFELWEEQIKKVSEKILKKISASQETDPDCNDELVYTLETFLLASKLLEKGYHISYQASW